MCNTVHSNVVKVAVSHSASQNGDPVYLTSLPVATSLRYQVMKLIIILSINKNPKFQLIQKKFRIL